MLAILRSCAAALLALAVLCETARAEPFGPFAFDSYRLEHRAKLVFPGKRVRVSPYPMSKRAAAVWASDFCFRKCTAHSGWRFQACAPARGPETCRFRLDADNRTCLRSCRTMGGPMLNLAN